MSRLKLAIPLVCAIASAPDLSHAAEPQDLPAMQLPSCMGLPVSVQMHGRVNTPVFAEAA